MNKYLLIIVVVSLALLTQANAEYYKYIDENGNVVFTDNAGNIPENQRSKVKTFKEQQDAPSRSDEKNINIQYKTEKESQRELRDILRKESGAKEACLPETKDQARQAIKATWAEMAQAMASGNLEKAFGFFSFFSRDKMKREMSDMSKEQIKNIFSNYESIEIYTLRENDGIASCGVIRKEKSGTFSYPVSFGRDLDCKWRIRGL
jgi:hypothetical protein